MIRTPSLAVHLAAAGLGAACLVGFAGCGYSTAAVALPSHLHTIAIPQFENGTNEYTIEQDITTAVVDRFVADNHLKVVDERSADAVLRGRVTIYKNSVFGISPQNLAQEYRVTIAVSVTLKDQVKNRELWSDENLVKTANYYVQNVPGQEASTELDGRKNAIAKIADEILARSVQGW
jgi:outer membrane lipopolysaccharide assembly protein LptE/RlpB